MYVVYILLCADNSFYTGITHDMEKRFAQHVAGTAARYTRSRGVLSIVYTEHKRTKGSALKREYAIKQMTRKQKEELVRTRAIPLMTRVWQKVFQQQRAQVRIVRRYVKKSIAGPTAEYRVHRERARSYVTQRLSELNAQYGFTYHRVSIRNSKTRWGSCSSKKNLNIHYRVLLLRPELADYVLTHELCHLQEMNHSVAFWRLVSRTIPNYSTLREELRQISL